MKQTALVVKIECQPKGLGLKDVFKQVRLARSRTAGAAIEVDARCGEARKLIDARRVYQRNKGPIAVGFAGCHERAQRRKPRRLVAVHHGPGDPRAAALRVGVPRDPKGKFALRIVVFEHPSSG